MLNRHIMQQFSVRRDGPCLLCVARLWSMVVEGVVSEVYESLRMGESKSPWEPVQNRQLACTLGGCYCTRNRAPNAVGALTWPNVIHLLIKVELLAILQLGWHCLSLSTNKDICCRFEWLTLHDAVICNSCPCHSRLDAQ
jgi:hypothetical protein